MRTVIVNNIISIDGCFADADGDPLALQMDGAFDRANLEDIDAAELIMLGRDSFDGFSSHWPYVAAAPEPEDPDAPSARAFDSVNRAIGRAYDRLQKIVVSDRGPVDASNPWHDSTTLLPRDEAADWLRRARSEGDGTIVVLASHVLWNRLLADGLVDELHLMISPHPLGAGVPAFAVPARLDLLEARTFDDSTNVQLRYAVRR